MLVNATAAPGPALWQGVMLCLLPLLFFGMIYRDGRYFRLFAVGYAVIGAGLLVVIIRTTVGTS